MVNWMVDAPLGHWAGSPSTGWHDWPQVVLYRPILEWGPPLDEGLSLRWIGLHFFFSFELSYLKVAKKASLAGAPEVGAKTSCRPHFHCAEWSCVVLSDPPRLRIKLGKDWPVKSPSGP